MSFYRRQVTRTDLSQEPIVEALREIGVKVWVIGRPVDLLTLYRGVWLPIECKTPGKKRKDQPEQDKMVEECGIPRVTTPEEALKAVLDTAHGAMEG